MENWSKKAKLIKKSGTYNYKMIIPTDVERKIRYICKNSWETEWSGVLFFTYNGTFENNDLTITCKDILVMDIGNATYTEFTMNPEVVSYMAENQELLDCQMALVHSHNNMSTFFSNTDQDTLLEEGLDRNNFVSLIVNNKGEYTAAITRKVKTKKISYATSYSFFDKGDQDTIKEVIDEETNIEWFNLNIIIEGEDQFADIKEKMESIRKSKAKDIPAWDKNYKNWGSMKDIKPTGLFVHDTPLNRGYYSDYDYIDDTNDMSVVGSDIKYSEDLDALEFDKDTVRSIVLQLITGSVIISNTTKLDTTKWVNSMESLYNSRFNKNMKSFKEWAETFVEFLIYDARDERLELAGLEDIDIVYICANSVQKELQKLKSNPYIKVYIELLENHKVF